jgi:hypothetical protein
MKVLTYKRTHVGDPDALGRFGINDCMGQVRNHDFDAVIGVGGVGSEAKSYNIDGKVNWIGLNPKKANHPNGRGLLVEFEKFVLFENRGPILNDIAPLLAKRMYQGKVRYLISGYSSDEQAETESIIQWLVDEYPSIKKTELSIRNDKCFSPCYPKISKSGGKCHLTHPSSGTLR